METFVKTNSEFKYLYACGKLKIPNYDKRDYVNFLIVKDKYAYRTDSKILIKFETKLLDGTYQFNKVTKTTINLLKIDLDIDMPNCDAVLNIDDKYPAEINLNEMIEPHIIELYLLFGVIIQKQYLDSVASIQDTFIAYGSDNLRPLIFDSPCCRIAVMSIINK